MEQYGKSAFFSRPATAKSGDITQRDLQPDLNITESPW